MHFFSNFVADWPVEVVAYPYSYLLWSVLFLIWIEEMPCLRRCKCLIFLRNKDFFFTVQLCFFLFSSFFFFLETVLFLVMWFLSYAMSTLGYVKMDMSVEITLGGSCQNFNILNAYQKHFTTNLCDELSERKFGM